MCKSNKIIEASNNKRKFVMVEYNAYGGRIEYGIADCPTGRHQHGDECVIDGIKEIKIAEKWCDWLNKHLLFLNHFNTVGVVKIIKSVQGLTRPDKIRFRKNDLECITNRLENTTMRFDEYNDAIFVQGKPRLVWKKESKDYEQCVKVVDYNAFTFRMNFCGRDNAAEARLFIMTKDGTWEQIETNHSLDFKFREKLIQDETDEDRKRNNENAENIFIDYITNIY